MNKIKVKRELLADWLAALRSGKYKQGKSTLVIGTNENDVCYCCLGVKIHLEDSKLCDSYYHELLNDDCAVQVSTYTEWDDGRNLKNPEFMDFLQYEIVSGHTVEKLLMYLNDGFILKTTLIQLKSVVESVSNFVSKHDDIAINNNSSTVNLTFSQIADFIEEELVEYID